MESKRKIILDYICRLIWSELNLIWIYLILYYHSINLFNYFSYICHLLALYIKHSQSETFLLLKGNPNFQGRLNWILQILHYYCRKQRKNIKNSWIFGQNLVLSFPSLCLLWFLLSVTFLNGRMFSFLEQSTLQILNVTSDNSCCV